MYNGTNLTLIFILYSQDPPTKSPKLSRQSSKSSTSSRTPQRQPPPLQLDNPLYHVCEGELLA